MATHSVNVLIKARDEASKKFGVIGISSKVMGTALAATARSIRWSFTRAFAGISAAARMAFNGITAMARRALNTIKTTVRRIALGIAAAYGYATYAAMKQQAAEIELASALKMAGTYSDALMEKLKQQASEIQKNSVYGDEYVLTLMRMAKTLGWAEDKLGDAAKAAIALHAGFGGGRGKPEIFLRYYTDAINGTAKSLDTYIGELRKAKTEEERQIILQKAIARGWDVVKSKTDSATGALKQMWNAIGDAAETLGGPFLADITRTAKAIKKWSEDNQDAIARFAETVHSYVTLAKDMFVAYVKFMQEDWKDGFHKSLDATLVLFQAWGKSLKLMMEKIFMDIGVNISTWLYNARQWKKAQRAVAKVLLEQQGLRWGAGGVALGPGTLKELRAARKKAEERAAEIVSEYGPEASGFELRKPVETMPWKKVWEESKANMQEALSQVRDIMPNFAAKIDEALKEHGQRLAELKNKYTGKPSGGEGKPLEPPPPKAIETLLSGMRGQLAAREARFLTFAPGTRFDYAAETAKNTGRQITLQERTVGSIKKLVSVTKQTLSELEGLNNSENRINLTVSDFA